jgi:ribosomal protein S18 acetylase RimI-like enzyme
MHDLVIRDFRQDETETLVRIAVAAWEPVYVEFRRVVGDALFHAMYPTWQDDKARQIRSACRPDRTSRVLVAELRGEVVGFVTFYERRHPSVAEIGNNAVHPDYQNRGVATRLYERVFDELRAAGVRFVKVETGGDRAHAPARRAYEKVGFDRAYPGVTYFREL